MLGSGRERFSIIGYLVFLCIPMLINGVERSPDGEPLIEILEVDPETTVEDLAEYGFIDYEMYDLDPGSLPEGDYLGWVSFTNDGERVFVTNRVTDNITVFDWQTMDVITNIEVGDYPGGIAVTDSHLLVACAFSDEIFVINLDDYSVDTIFALPQGQQPWVVRVNADGSRAYVACDISNTCEVFDLDNMIHLMTISDFPVSLMSWGFTSENGRNSFSFSNFTVTPDGNHLVVGDYEDTLFFFNTVTGSIDHAIPGVPSCPIVGLSGDGSKAVAVSVSNPAVVHQIDLVTHTVTSSVTLTGYSISMISDVAVNFDGSKAFIGVSNNQSAIIRFSTNDFVTLTSTYTAFWIGTSPDHSLVISGQYRFSIVDFATETVLGQYLGNSQYRGSVSPIGYRVASFDPYQHEGIYFYDYSAPSTPQYRGTTESGLAPEGDAPRRVAITPDGSKAVVTNVVSDNAVIIDLDAYTIDTLLPIGDRVQDIAITSDSRWAVICGFNSNSVKVIDLDSNMVVADVPTGTRAGVVSIGPGDDYAYVGNISANTVSVVRLAGSASQEIAEVSCGVIGVVWAAYGVSSEVRASPSGEYILVASSFDDVVKVIDTLTNSVVASVPVGDFPIQVAFDGTGDYAVVTNYFDDTYSVLHVDGAASSVVGSFVQGDGPLRLGYNSVDDEIGIGYYYDKKVVHVDPQTGSYLGADFYTNYGTLIQVKFDEYGDPLVLTMSDGSVPGHFHRGSEAIALPAVPSYFDYSPSAQKAVVVMPGPDIVSVIDWDTLGVGGVTTIPLSARSLLYPVSPNPGEGLINIEFYLRDNERVEITIYDVLGRCVYQIEGRQYEPGKHSVLWDGLNGDGGKVVPGSYFVHVKIGAYSAIRKLVYVR